MLAIMFFCTKGIGRGFHFFQVGGKAPPSSKTKKNSKAKPSTLILKMINK